MKHSLFRRLFLLHVGILVIAVAMIAILLSVLYTRTAFQQKRQALNSAAAMVSATMQDYFSGTLTGEGMARDIDRIGYITDSRVYVILYDAGTLAAIDADLSAAAGLSVPLVDDLETLLSGRTVFRSRLHSDALDTDVLLAGYPLLRDTSIVGGIVMFTPLSRIRQDVWQISLVIAGAALVAILLGSLLILSVSRRMTRPIRQMQDAAVELASGTNPDPIPVTGEDEIARLTIAFNRMQAQLTQTERVRREFIANVSHELRTPLTSIHGFIRGLLDGVGKPEEREAHLEIVMREIQRLMALTEDILDLAKLQSGSMRLSRGHVDLAALARDTVSVLSGLASEKRISVRIEEDGPLTLWGDANRLRQVLVNLLGNALKYTGEGGHIVVSTRRETDMATLRVRDDGIGIPETERPFVFDKFHRVDKTGHREHGGSGLGLNIARTIVELHRGTIRAEASPEGGTDMIVRIPATSGSPHEQRVDP